METIGAGVVATELPSIRNNCGREEETIEFRFYPGYDAFQRRIEKKQSFSQGVLGCRRRRRRCPSRWRCLWRRGFARSEGGGWCGSGGKRIGTGDISSWAVPFWCCTGSSPRCKTRGLDASTLPTAGSSSCSPSPGPGLSTASGRIAGTSSVPPSHWLAFVSSCSCLGNTT